MAQLGPLDSPCEAGFKVSVEFGMTRPSCIRFDTCRDKTDTRHSIMHELNWESIRLGDSYEFLS